MNAPEVRKVEDLVDADALEGFAGAFHGGLTGPGDPGYEEERRIWNGMIDRHPALIARCRDVSDVIAAVDFAREQHLEV
ncbi:MAG TPA: hypothetical protein VKA48_12445, partial [Gammaproteobacteria bacterium]|nr:hypothetical protein [Gammaproteobacteria bacterium]